MFIKGVQTRGTLTFSERKKQEITGGCMKLYNDVFHDLYYLSSIIISTIKTKIIQLVRYVARKGQMRNAYEILARNFEGKRWHI